MKINTLDTIWHDTVQFFNGGFSELGQRGMSPPASPPPAWNPKDIFIKNPPPTALSRVPVESRDQVQTIFGGTVDPEFDGSWLGANGQALPAKTSTMGEVNPVLPSNFNGPTAETVVYINGIISTATDAANTMQRIANVTGDGVVSIHNSSGGAIDDLLQAAGDKLDEGKNKAVDAAARAIYAALTDPDNKQKPAMHLVLHSQGALIGVRALERVRGWFMTRDHETRKQIEARFSALEIETFGGAATDYPDGPKYVHYVNSADLVPDLFGLGNSFLQKHLLDHTGRNASVIRFTEDHHSVAGNHDFSTMYLSHRLPFDQAYAMKGV